MVTLETCAPTNVCCVNGGTCHTAKHAQTGERGPTSARVNMSVLSIHSTWFLIENENLFDG